MKLKLESFKKAHQPVRLVKQLDRAVNNYKPVATHKHLVRILYINNRNSYLRIIFDIHMIN